MSTLFRKLFSFNGHVSRGQYFVTATLLTALKYFLDASIAHHFAQPWPITNYILPPQNLTVFGIGSAFPRLYVTLWAIAIPFFWAGISLTLRRLRDAGHRVGWVFLFFVPLLNLALFLSLSFVPTASSTEQLLAEEHDADLDPTYLPAASIMTATGPVAGVILASILGLLLVLFSANVLAQYAWDSSSACHLSPASSPPGASMRKKFALTASLSKSALPFPS